MFLTHGRVSGMNEKALDLYFADIPQSEIFSLISDQIRDRFFIAQQQDRNHIGRFQDGASAKEHINEKLDSLFIFDSDHFMRITKIQGGRFRLITDIKMKNGAEPMRLSFFEERERTYYLWGKQLKDDTYFENRIPKILTYPVSRPYPESVRIKAHEYTDAYGNIVFFRFSGLSG